MLYYLLIIIGILTRFLPHPANFTAVGAVALFSGYYFKDKKWALIVPILIMLASDWKIGFYSWPIMASVYLAFALTAFLGMAISRKKWFYSLPMSLVAALVFYAITNWAVWQFGTWYPHTTAGLVACMVAGIPFIKGTILGNLVYTAVLFGVAEIVKYLVHNKNPKLEKVLVR